MVSPRTACPVLRATGERHDGAFLNAQRHLRSSGSALAPQSGVTRRRDANRRDRQVEGSSPVRTGASANPGANAGFGEQIARKRPDAPRGLSAAT